jgi:DMSO/TMAO reductase YedYZ heme-binding membrane subunit
VSLVAALGGPRALWYATRGTGVVSLILLTAVVCLGVGGVRRLRGRYWPRFLVLGLHRNLTLLALAFLALHIATTIADGFAPIALRDTVVPFASGYRPIWLGLGAVALDLLLALTITSLLRARLGYRHWRALHWMAYAAWPVALVHAFGTGSDSRISWMQALGVALTAMVAVAVVARLGAPSVPAGTRTLGAAALLLVTLGTLAWYATGPGASGWAARAGTPASLLPHRVVASPAAIRSAPAARTRAASQPPLAGASLRGSLTSSEGSDGLVVVDIRGRTRRPAGGVLWIRIQGQPVDAGGVAMVASGASYGPPSAPSQYLGKIVSLHGTHLVLALRGASRRVSLRVDLQIDSVSHRVTGTLAAAGGSPA